MLSSISLRLGEVLGTNCEPSVTKADWLLILILILLGVVRRRTGESSIALDWLILLALLNLRLGVVCRILNLLGVGCTTAGESSIAKADWVVLLLLRSNICLGDDCESSSVAWVFTG
uniref:Uncharacterized protein n=1 Tax=Cacopsylla melanoneura TaxID=428564 RepID=A0A8D8Q891_9HEMI